MDDSVKTIAANVRRLRLDRGLSGAALARASRVGRATLAVLEAGLLRQAPVDRARVEVYELRVLPGRPRRADPHQAGVVEQLLVHAGRLRIGPEQDPVELAPGDFVAFDGSVAHVYEALGEAVTATLVMTSP